MASPKSKEEVARQRKSQLVPWIANPFTKHGHSDHHEDSISLLTGNKEANSNEDAIEALEKENSRDKKKLEEAEEVEEATPIELFYDLFFVANLTTVTAVHYITGWTTLSSYILFFIILWFTWLHVTLLDVRFSVDSVYERVCKTLHFATMAAFSSVSTTWDPFSPDEGTTVTALRTMTLALMFSRFVLGIQYFVVMCFGRSKPKTVVPLAIHGSVMITSAAVYLGLFFTFAENRPVKSYIAWYVMATFEIVAVIATSSFWKSVCFKETHLIERMGLLTLIIFGEGIIVMLKGINAIVKSFGWTPATFGVVATALLVIYFYWMFYFDYNPKNVQYGRIRQQIWTLLHFPFHLSIVLSVEGLRQLATMYNYYLKIFDTFSKSVEGYDGIVHTTKMVDFVNQTLTTLYDDGTAKTIRKEWTTTTTEIKQLREISSSGDADHRFSDLFDTLLSKIVVGLGESYGFKVPEKKYSNLSDQQAAFGHLFDFVYQYFFIALGCIFILYGIFAIIVRRHMDVFDWMSVSLRFALAATFFGMVGLPYSEALYYPYMGSPWPIPSVCLMIFFVLVVDKILGTLTLKRGK